MNFKLKILIFLSFFKLQSNSKKNDVLVISLGNACGVAGALREYNIRNEAYPFDWIVSPFKSVYAMIETDFDNFLMDNALVIRSDGSAVIDTINNFEFVHDFPTVYSINQTEHEEIQAGKITSIFLNYLPQIKEKYNRRISRFINACKGNKRVIFIRNRDISMQQAFALCKLLTQKYPQLNYILVLIDDQNNMCSEMDIFQPQIKNFYGTPYINYDNNKSSINWELIFNNLGLIT
ncbi:MAG: papain-like cysteine peptidase [Candidatus Babeliaceae bacterium]|nr:papain-like cysteine peptidase [Candidatus Babeliaceae bacterium]